MLAARTCDYAAVFALAHVCLRHAVRRTCIEPRYRCDWINRVLASTHAAISGAIGSFILLTQQPFADMLSDVMRFRSPDTVHGNSDLLIVALPFTLGYFLYDCVVMAIDDEVYMPLMVVHHIISLVVWPVSLFHRAGVFYIAWFLATEVSTPLLHLTVFFLPKHGVDGAIPTVVGLSLIVVFFLVRVLPGPMMLLSLAQSWRFWSDVHPAVTATAMLTIPIPPFLFGYWFYKLVAGAVKALQKPEDGEDTRKSD